MTKARTLADNFAADINGITAGTGITGGGTSGTVTITNDMATAINAKGDLVVGTGADAYARLAVASTAGYLLAVDSGETTGLKWAAPVAGGKVLQVVTATTTSGTATTSSSYSDTNLTASITPSSSTSTILVLVAQTFDNVNGTGAVKILRGATDIFESWGNAIRGSGIWNYSIVDSPATTSSTTYKTQFKSNAGSSFTVQSDGSKSTITLLEIGA